MSKGCADLKIHARSNQHDLSMARGKQVVRNRRIQQIHHAAQADYGRSIYGAKVGQIVKHVQTGNPSLNRRKLGEKT